MITRNPCYTDPVANLTLSIADDLLKRARIRAIEEDTSVNEVVRTFLESYAAPATRIEYADPETAAKARQELVELSMRSTAGSGPGGRSWTREDLYDERLSRWDRRSS